MTFKASHRPSLILSPMSMTTFNQWISSWPTSALTAVSVSLHTPLGGEDFHSLSLPSSGRAAFDRLMSLLEPQLRELAMVREGGDLFVDVAAEAPAIQPDDFTFWLVLAESPFDQGQRVGLRLAAI